MSHPSHGTPQDPNIKDFGPTRANFGPANTPPPSTPLPSAPQFTGYGYGGQPIDPRTGQPFPPYGYQPQPAKPSNGLAIASLILGIVGLSLAWIPIINYLAMVLGIIALVLGGIGIFKSHRWMSIAGATLGLLAIVASFAVLASFANAMNQAADDYNAAVAEAPTAPALTEPYTGEAEGEGYPAPGYEAASDGDVMADNAWKLEKVTLSDAQLGIMTARVTNNGPEARIAFVEVAVLLDGEYIGSGSGATDWTEAGETDTVHLLSADLDLDPTTDPSRISYELTAQ